MLRYSFGPFELDPAARLLRRDGEPIPLAGKTLDTLLVLVENRGRLVDKEELLSRVWAGSVVEEANLAQAIFTVRKILGDSPKDHRYIATVAGRGYQFVAPVAEVKGEPPQRAAERIERRPFWRRDRVMLLGLVVLLVVAAAVWFARRRGGGSPGELVERQLTFNSSAGPIGSAALSPDGNYLAYSDPAGIHLRLMTTGEERMIPAVPGIPPSAITHVDSWFPDGSQLFIDSEQPGRHSLWTISLMGQSPRELRSDSKAWSLSPDGALIAFSPYGKIRELWLMDSHGEGAKKILELPANEWLHSARWSPDRQRLAYIRGRANDVIIQTCDLNGANQATLVAVPKSEHWLADIAWLSGGRIVYALVEGFGLHDSSLWQLAVDAHSQSASGKPSRITHWIGPNVLGLSASAAGNRLLVRKGTYGAQAFLGELEAQGERMRSSRRLTNNQAENQPSAWTADSKSVLFASNRNGKWGIYRQEVTQNAEEPIVTGLEVAYLPRLSPDGAWILYMEDVRPLGHAYYRLMRVPVNGGSPQFVCKLRSDGFDFSCARSPATFCALGESSEDGQHWVLTAVDPVKGRGKRLRAIYPDNAAEGLSPDGSTFASAKTGEPETHINLLSLTGGSDREIVLKSWPGIRGLDWSPDGKGLYCGFSSPQGGTLVYVELNGHTHVLWHSSEVGANAFLAGVPSPDGRHLAIWGGVNNDNVWMLEGF